MLDSTVRWQLITVNPCAAVELPANRKRETDFYDIEEVKAFLPFLMSLPEQKQALKVGILIALFGGLRKGEICGLDWPVVDFDRKGVHISKTRMYVRGEGLIETSPKSKSGYRWVSLPDFVLAEMRTLQLCQKKLRLQQGSLWINSNAVLTKDNGEPYHPGVFAKHFSQFIKDSGLRYISLHKLRHTYVSLLAFLQIDQLEISRTVGHAQPSTTMNIYTHIFSKNDHATADQLETFFDQNLAIHK